MSGSCRALGTGAAFRRPDGADRSVGGAVVGGGDWPGRTTPVSYVVLERVV
jgi:hypothetical protein